MDDINFMIECQNKLDGLVEARNSLNFGTVYDYMETLTDAECRRILKLIVYGQWKKFDDEQLTTTLKED